MSDPIETRSASDAGLEADMRERAAYMNRRTSLPAGLGTLIGVVAVPIAVIVPPLGLLAGIVASILGLVGWAGDGQRNVGLMAISFGMIDAAISLAFMTFTISISLN